jgi:glycosyltransferase involved in cell wall biosynthesis
VGRDLLRLAYLSSFPPRECGLATFTLSVVQAVNRASSAEPGWVIAVNDAGSPHAYPPAVRFQIERDEARSYAGAATWVNDSDRDVVNIQHEYGLFGGLWGSHLLEFMRQVRRPVVLTLHTVLPAPCAELREITQELIACASETVVLARAAAGILRQDYGVGSDDIHFIPHGVPNVPFASPEAAKQALGLAGRRVIVTCGLINPAKGIEYAVEAMAGLVREFPDLLYLVVGETHPGVRQEAGERYRDLLATLVQEFGLGDHVRFVNRYLGYRELVQYLLASDVCLVPYLNLDQIVSGTLAYALGCGRAVVSTPSTYAREVLADGRGVLVPPRSAPGIESAVAKLFRDDELRQRLQRAAYELGHTMIWPRVATRYLDVFQLAFHAGKAPGERPSVRDTHWAGSPWLAIPAGAGKPRLSHHRN